MGNFSLGLVQNWWFCCQLRHLLINFYTPKKSETTSSEIICLKEQWYSTDINHLCSFAKFRPEQPCFFSFLLFYLCSSVGTCVLCFVDWLLPYSFIQFFCWSKGRKTGLVLFTKALKREQEEFSCSPFMLLSCLVTMHFKVIQNSMLTLYFPCHKSLSLFLHTKRCPDYIRNISEMYNLPIKCGITNSVMF